MAKRDTILIVDDLELNRVILNDVFQPEYNILEARDGYEAIRLIRRHRAVIALVMLDIIMPKMNGYEVLLEMKAEGYINEIPVMIVTAMDKIDTEIQALDLGAADIVTKPIEPQIVKRRAKNIIQSTEYRRQLERKVKLKEERIGQTYQSMIDTVNSIMGHRNMESAAHTLCVGECTRLLLTQLKAQYPEYNLNRRRINRIADAALLHDVGKLVLSDTILHKRGNLNEEEEAMYRSHCTEGCRIIGGFEQTGQKDFLEYAYSICKYHHEYWDGSGYPEGLKGDNIPICAQAVGLSREVYHFLVKKQYTKEQTYNKITAMRGRYFSREMVQCFQAVYDNITEKIYAFQNKTEEQNRSVVLRRLLQVFEKDKVLGASRECPKYHSLLRHLEATVYEIDVVTGFYSRVFTTFCDFVNVPVSGSFQNDFIEAMREDIGPEYGETVIAWLYKIIDREGKGYTLSLGETCHIYNSFYQEYQWYQISIIEMEAEVFQNKKVLLILKNVNDRIHTQSEIARINSQAKGIVADMHRYKLENAKLKVKAQIDQLTKLYNKITTQEMAAELIRKFPDGKYALMVIDFDNFKMVNDRFGHLQGDKALIEFGKSIMKQCRESDVVGRIGGDEFVVFMTNYSDKNTLELKANNILSSIRIMGRDNNMYEMVTASIGIAVYPEQGKTYEELFQKADLALYASKKMGKNQWRFYTEDNPVLMEFKELRRKKPARIEGNLKACDNFNKSISGILCDAKDEKELTETVLDMVSRHYGLEDAFMADMEKGEIIFGWHGEAGPLAKTTHLFLYREIRDMMKNQGKKGYTKWICSDINTLSGEWVEYFRELQVTAFIMLPIYYDNNLSAIAAFTDKKGPREWKEDEIEACDIAARMFSGIIFLRQLKKVHDRAAQLVCMLSKVNHNEFYIVNDSYEMLSIEEEKNEKKELIWSDKCYRRLRGNVSPCLECPIKQLGKSCDKIAVNNITATKFSWGEEEYVYFLEVLKD